MAKSQLNKELDDLKLPVIDPDLHGTAPSAMSFNAFFEKAGELLGVEIPFKVSSLQRFDQNEVNRAFEIILVSLHAKTYKKKPNGNGKN